MPPAVFFEMSVTAVLTVWSPGPNNILLLSSASKFGVRKNMCFMLGIWTGSLTLMLLCGYFCNGLTAVIPQLQTVLPYAGSLYLIYLAWQTARRLPPSDHDTSRIPSFPMGIFLQLINVKIIIYGLTMFTAFILPNIRSSAFIFPFAIYLMALGAVGNLIWAVAGNMLRTAYEKHYRLINIIMALLLIWCALRVMGSGRALT